MLVDFSVFVFFSVNIRYYFHFNFSPHIASCLSMILTSFSPHPFISLSCITFDVLWDWKYFSPVVLSSRVESEFISTNKFMVFIPFHNIHSTNIILPTLETFGFCFCFSLLLMLKRNRSFYSLQRASLLKEFCWWWRCCLMWKKRELMMKSVIKMFQFH